MPKKRKHPLLVKLGRQGGKKRAKNLSAEARKEIARKAARARWGTSKKKA